MNFSGVEEALNNTTFMPPVYSYLPPTDDVTLGRLILAILFVFCLTASLSANVAQFVLQLYCRRVKDGYPVQHFIAATFVLNALLPLSLPPLILERLVKLWMFGPFSCNFHHGLLAFGRVIIPWMLLMVNTFVLFCFMGNHRRYDFMPVLCTFVIILLILIVVMPQAIAATYSLVDKSGHNEGSFIMLIHYSTCILPPAYGFPRFLQLAVEILIPYSLFFAVCFKIYLIRPDSLGKSVVGRLMAASAIQFMCNVPALFPVSWKACERRKKERKQLIQVQMDHYISQETTPADFIILLPYLASSLIWHPLSEISAVLAQLRENEIRAENHRSTNFPMVSSNRHLLQPTTIHR